LPIAPYLDAGAHASQYRPFLVTGQHHESGFRQSRPSHFALAPSQGNPFLDHGEVSLPLVGIRSARLKPLALGSKRTPLVGKDFELRHQDRTQAIAELARVAVDIWEFAEAEARIAELEAAVEERMRQEERVTWQVR
jgi:hypothetical protein